MNTYLSSRRFPRHPLSSFMIMPQSIRFETQRESEPIILFLRRHPITNIPWIVISFFMLLLPIMAVFFLSSIEVIVQLVSLSPGLPVVLGSLWYLTTLGYIISNFLVWYFTVNIATTERVVDIDFYFLLYKEFSEALLNRIEDVTFITGGFVAAFFDFGNVFIQTAATSERIDFDHVPRPQEVVRIITELVQEAGRRT